jgi:hypothetical protein
MTPALAARFARSCTAGGERSGAGPARRRKASHPAPAALTAFGPPHHCEEEPGRAEPDSYLIHGGNLRAAGFHKAEFDVMPNGIKRMLDSGSRRTIGCCYSASPWWAPLAALSPVWLTRAAELGTVRRGERGLSAHMVPRSALAALGLVADRSRRGATVCWWAACSSSRLPWPAARLPPTGRARRRAGASLGQLRARRCPPSMRLRRPCAALGAAQR